ncbi:MAG TPA: hypothetical protein VKB34_07930 [Povalibacter sp.]|nr:hypothetical protein [Povalibacter sp.]
MIRITSRCSRGPRLFPPYRLRTVDSAPDLKSGGGRIAAGQRFPFNTSFGRGTGNLAFGWHVNDAFPGLDDTNAAVDLASTGQGMRERWEYQL